MLYSLSLISTKKRKHELLTKLFCPQPVTSSSVQTVPPPSILKTFKPYPSPMLLFRSPSLFYLLVHGRCGGFLFSLYHTQITHTTFGRTPLDEGSVRCRDLYVKTYKHSQETNIHTTEGIRTHDHSKRPAADLRLRPCGHFFRDGETPNIVSVQINI
jgi:hypothetical protein